MDKAAIFSVIFKQNLPYLDSYLKSLVVQDEKKFDVILLVDNVPDIENHLLPYRDLLNIIPRFVTGTISSIRKFGIDLLNSQNYPYIIFSDTDDIFSTDRIKVSCDNLESFPIVVNDLSPFTIESSLSEQGHWSSRLKDGQVFSSEDLLLHNFVGLGNSAVRREVLTYPLAWPELRALDWYVFYQWLQRKNGVFLHKGRMHYRQHNGNIAGLQVIDKEKIKYILDVKIEHYSFLASQTPRAVEELKKSSEILGKIDNDPFFLFEAIDRISKQAINYFWWEETEYIHKDGRSTIDK